MENGNAKVFDLSQLLNNATALEAVMTATSKDPAVRRTARKAKAPANPKHLTIIDGGIGIYKDTEVTVYETGCGNKWYLYKTETGNIMVDCATVMQRKIEGLPEVTELLESDIDWDYERHNVYSRDFALERAIAKEDVRMAYAQALEPNHPVFVR